MKKQREKEFCTALANAIKDLGGWAFKIPDTPASFFGDKARFCPVKRFDIVCTGNNVDGKLLAVEAKMWSLKSDPILPRALKLLREEQFDALSGVMKAGGRSFIVLKRFIPRHSEYFLVKFSTGEITKVATPEDMARIILGPMEDAA